MKVGDRVRVTGYVGGSIPPGGTGTITRLPSEHSPWYSVRSDAPVTIKNELYSPWHNMRSDDPVAHKNKLHPPDKEFLFSAIEFELIGEVPIKVGDRVEVTKYNEGGIPKGELGTITELPGLGGWYSILPDVPIRGKTDDKTFLLTPEEFRVIEEDVCICLGEVESALSEPEYHGHPRFNELLREFKLLHSNKNYDYARGGDPLGNFKRVSEQIGIPASQFAHHLMMKQVDAVSWSYRQGGKAKVEGPIDKLRDIAVYATLQIILLEEERDGK